MKQRISLVMVGAVVAAFLATATPATATATQAFDARAFRRAHGYLPLRGVATLEAAKAHAAAIVGSRPSSPTAGGVLSATASIGSNWKGVSSSNVSPPDPNGAIGPTSYVEIVNQKIGIYQRSGSLIASANLSSLTGKTNDSDPMILWDPDTQRFYYNVLNVSNATMDWGFSKSSNPTSIPGDFCNYETGFGYAPTSIPDYPKLGQTKDFLLIGDNFYPTNSSQAATSADLLWIAKPQGQASISTCPAAGSSGKITGLLNEDLTQTFTPTPAIQTDPSSTGYVVAMSDIECPPTCGTGTLLTVFTITDNAGVPAVSAPASITVGAYQSPPSAPQKRSSNLLDTLDGRITHAVSGLDPRIGATTVWVAHTVLGGAGSQINWYEVDPTANVIAQSGSVSSPSLYVLNAGISNDRTCTATACGHGDSMALGFTTSSSSSFPAIQMVSKSGADPQSAFTLVKQSTKADKGFTCMSSTHICRWGDYGGATPDPAADLTAAHGEVWLTNQWTTGGGVFSSGDATENWEAKL